MPILRRLLQDPEAEVRTRAIFQLPTVGEHLPSADRQVMLLTNLMAPVTDLVGDSYVVQEERAGYQPISPVLHCFHPGPTRTSILP